MTTFRSLALALALSGCGAADAHSTPATEPAAEPEPPPRSAEAPADIPEPEPPPPPPEPEPVAIEPGAALGPIRIGMSEDDVRALGLEERPGDRQSSIFGPYRVYFDDRGVRRIEAFVGELERVRVGDQVLPAGTHIHVLRDAFADCVWYEGGGERYRCANGTLFVHTSHTMDPARYTIAVVRP